MSTIGRISHHTNPDRPSRQGRLARRAGRARLGDHDLGLRLHCHHRVAVPDVRLRGLLHRAAEAYLQHEFALGVHVLSGVLALLIGPFQFVRRLRRRFVRVHRFIGATYVASATVRWRVPPRLGCRA
jgi:Predicted membrane protein (DUF2306)